MPVWGVVVHGAAASFWITARSSAESRPFERPPPERSSCHVPSVKTTFFSGPAARSLVSISNNTGAGRGGWGAAATGGLAAHANITKRQANFIMPLQTHTPADHSVRSV